MKKHFTISGSLCKSVDTKDDLRLLKDTILLNANQLTSAAL